MKKIAKITSYSLFYCLIIINFHISVFGPSYLLHGSNTLSDGLENPQIPVFKGSDKNFGLSLLKLNYNLEMVGKSANKLSNFLLHEKLDFDKSNWKSSSAMNYINSTKNIDIITFRYVLDKENETELTYAWQWISLDHFGFSDNFLNSLIMGSSLYRGERLEAMFNTNIFSVSYLKLTYGLRRSFKNKKLHLGLNYHWYPQLHQSAYNISESFFYYDYIKTEVHIKGNFSTLNKNQNILFQNIFKSYKNQFENGISLNQSSDIKQIFSENIFESFARGVSFGIGYEFNKKLYTSFTLKDLAFISKSENVLKYNFEIDSTYGGQFTLGYDTTQTTSPSIDTIIFTPNYNNQNFFKYFDSLLISNSKTVSKDNIELYIPIAFHLSATYKIKSWYNLTLNIHKYHNWQNIQFVLVNGFIPIKNWYFDFNFGIGTMSHTIAGAQIMYKNNSIEFFLGSEQFLNSVSSLVQYGSNIYMGFGVRL